METLQLTCERPECLLSEEPLTSTVERDITDKFNTEHGHAQNRRKFLFFFFFGWSTFYSTFSLVINIHKADLPTVIDIHYISKEKKKKTLYALLQG